MPVVCTVSPCRTSCGCHSCGALLHVNNSSWLCHLRTQHIPGLRPAPCSPTLLCEPVPHVCHQPPPKTRQLRQQSPSTHLKRPRPPLQPHTHPMVLRQPVPHVCHQALPPKEAPVHECHTRLCWLSQLEADCDHALRVLLVHTHLHKAEPVSEPGLVCVSDQ